MSLAPHPSRDELAGYVFGTLPADRIEMVAEHVETCAACEATVENLERQGDSLVAELRRPMPQDPDLDSPECRRAIVAAAALGQSGWADSAPLPAADAEPTVELEQLGEYKLLEKLGEGGMGAVYRALQVHLDRVVALKVLSKSRAGDPQAIARFYREMKAAGRLRHPNIVEAQDAREIDGSPVLVMEYVDGADLAELVQRHGPLPVADACELIRQAAFGLQHAHEHQLVHRDIKPSNLILERPVVTGDDRAARSRPQVKILDLGLALLRAEAVGPQEMTAAGQVMGTANYMAPEQITDAHRVDIRADIYALGCTLYKLLTGHAPFCDPKYDTPMKRLLARLSDPPAPVQDLRPDVPAALADVIDQLLARDPNERPRLPRDVAEALRPFTQGSDLAALQDPMSRPTADDRDPPSTFDHLPSAYTGTEPTIAIDTRDSSGRGGRRIPTWLAAAAGGAALLLFGGIVIIITNKDGSKTEINLPDDPAVEIQQDGKTIAKIPAKNTPLAPRDDTPPTNPPTDQPPEPPQPPATPPANQATPPATADAPIDYPAERKAAVWVVQHGSVQVADELGQILATASRQQPQLPDKPFVVVVVVLSNADIDDAGLANLAACQQIREAVLDGNPRVTAKGLKSLQRSKRLRKLNVARTSVGAGLGESLASWVELEALLAQGSQIDDDAVKDIPDLPRLQELSLADTALTESGLGQLVERCPNLREINTETASGSLPVSALRRLQFLRRASLRGDQLTDEAVAMLVQLPSLEQLELRSPVTDATLQRLPKFGAKLLAIRVSASPNRDLASSPTAAGYAALLDLPDLTEIQLDGYAGGPTDELLLRFAQLPVLRKLVLGYDEPACRYTAAGIAEFHRRRPDVEVIADGQAFPVLFAWPKAADGGIAAWDLPQDAPPPAIVPFSADEAKQHQDAWAKYLQEPVEIENSLGMKFRLIPPGECVTQFTSDWQDAVPSFAPYRQLRVSHPFYMGMTEVTYGQFQKFIEATGYITDAERLGNASVSWTDGPNPKLNWKTPGYEATADLPVTQVTPGDAQKFCQWLRTAENSVYRLPTEDEWEAAARGGSAGMCGWYQTPEERLATAWLSENRPDTKSLTQPVGTKTPNPFGLYDVMGNVIELCKNEPQMGLDTLWYGPMARRGRGAGPAPMVERTVSIIVTATTGFRVLRESNHPVIRPENTNPEADGNASALLAERDGVFAPALVRRGQPLSDVAVVSRPAKIPGIRSWSVEPKAHSSHDPVDIVAWSPGGELIATASMWYDNSVRLWDRDGNLKSVLLGHAGQVQSVSFSPDGKLLASCDIWQGVIGVRGELGDLQPSLRLWNTETGKCIALVRPGGWCRTTAFSPSGKSVAVGGYRFVGMLDLTTGGFWTSRMEDMVPHLAWSPDEQRLVVNVAKSAQPRVIDAETLKPVGDLSAGNDADGKPLAVWRPVYSPDGRWIAAVGPDRQVHLWDGTSLEHVKTVPTTASGGGCAWHRDGQKLAVWGEGLSQAWALIDISSGEITAQSTLGGGNTVSAWSPDGTELVTWNGRLVFSSAETGKVLRSAPDVGHMKCDGMSVSPDARLLLACGHAGHAWGKSLYDARTGSFLGIQTREAGNQHWLPNGKHSVSFGAKKLLIHDSAGRGLRELAEPPGIKSIWSSPDSRRIAMVTGDGAGLVWDWTSENVPEEIFPTEAKIATLAWSPDGRWIAAAAMGDKTVRLWNVELGTLARTFAGFPQPLGGMYNPTLIVWHPDCRNLWVALSTHAAPLDVITGQVGPLESFTNGYLIQSLALSPGGDRLLVGEGYGWMFLRDKDSGQRRLLGQHLGTWQDGGPQWLPDGRRFVGRDLGRVQTFDVGTNRRLGTLFPWIGGGDQQNWLCVSPEGHYRGGPLDRPASPEQPDEGTDPAGLAAVEQHIVYVTQLDDGSNVTYSPEEFRAKFGWQNDPKKARLLQLDE